MNSTRGIVVPYDVVRTFARSFRELVSEPGENLPLPDTKINDLHLFLTYWDTVAFPIQGPRHHIVDPSLAVPTTPDGRKKRERLQTLTTQGALTPVELEFDDWSEFANVFEPAIFSTGNSYLFDICANLQAKSKRETAWSVGDIYSQRRPAAGSANIDADPDTTALSVWAKLPVPDVDTPTDRLLKFKEARRPELLAFRTVMDEMSHALQTREGPDAEIVKCGERVEGALLDMHRVLDEGRIKKVAGSLKTYLSLSEFGAWKALAPAVGAITAPELATSPVVGALVGLGLNVALTVATRQDPTANLPDNLKPFRYPYFVSKV